MFSWPFVSRLYAGLGSCNNPLNCPTHTIIACAATGWHRAYCQSNHCTLQALTSSRSVLLNWCGSYFYVKLSMFETLCFHRLWVSETMNISCQWSWMDPWGMLSCGELCGCESCRNLREFRVWSLGVSMIDTLLCDAWCVGCFNSVTF